MVSDVPVSSTSDVELCIKVMKSVAHAIFVHIAINRMLIIFVLISYSIF